MPKFFGCFRKQKAGDEHLLLRTPKFVPKSQNLRHDNFPDEYKADALTNFST